MADFKNSDFIATYEELLDLTKQLTSKWDPSTSSEADPGVVLLKLLALLSDRQSYKKDLAEAQAYPDTVFDRQAAFDLLQMLGYTLKSNKSATGYVSASIELSGSAVAEIPIFTPITNAEQTLYYFTTSKTTFSSADSTKGKDVAVMEGSIFNIEKEGVDTFSIKDIDESGRFYLGVSNIAVNGVFVGIEDDGVYNYSIWQNIDSSVLYPRGTYFFVLADTTGENYIKFPSDFAEKIGSSNFIVKATYSAGADGNCKAGTLSRFFNSTDNLEGFVLRQYFDILTGENQESIKQGFQNYYNSMEIFNTIITSYDLNEAIKYILNDSDISESVKTQRLFSNSYSRTAIDRQLKIISNNGTVAYPYYAFDASEPDRVVDTLCLEPTIEYEDGFKIVNPNDISISSQIQKQLNNSKSLITEIKLTNTYMKANTHLEGVVYANIDTREQAAEILEKIISTLKSRYRAENLSFGKEIDYQDLVSTIKSSDSRILNSSISPLEYEIKKATYNALNNPSELDLSDSDKLNVAALSVINGQIPLYKFTNRSNKVDLSNLNPGYVNAGFNMSAYIKLGLATDASEQEKENPEINPIVVSVNNGATDLVENALLAPLQIIQFKKPLTVPDVEYGYGLYYYFYSPLQSDLPITSESTLSSGCLIKSGSTVMLSEETDTSTGIIAAYPQAFHLQDGKYTCSSLPSDYIVQLSVTLLEGSNLKIGSVITNQSTINGIIYTQNSITPDIDRTLGTNELLYIWSKSGSTNVVLRAGSKVRVSGLSIESGTSSTRPSLANLLSTSQSITTLKTDISEIPANSNYFVILNFGKAITISNGTSYLLDEGEFFVYSNSSLSEYIILGAGTELTSSESVTLDNIQTSETLENIKITVFSRLEKSLTAISNEITTFNKNFYLTQKGDNLINTDDLGWSNVEGEWGFSNQMSGENQQTFNSDYMMRVTLLLESDKDGQITFTSGVITSSTQLILNDGINNYTIGAENVTYNNLLCSKFLRILLTSPGQSLLVSPATAKFSVCSYSPSSDMNSPRSISGTFDSSSLTVSLTPPRGTSALLFKASNVETIEKSGTLLSKKMTNSKYDIYYLDDITAGEITLTLHGHNGDSYELFDLSYIAGYSDEIQSPAFTPSAGQLESVINELISIPEDRLNFDILCNPADDYEHPTEAINFFNLEHPWNYMTLPFIDFEKTRETLRVLPITGRFKA